MAILSDIKGRLVAALAVLVVAGSLSAQEAGRLDIPVDQAGEVAQAALRDGRPELAFAIARGMLERDANDSDAHLIMAILSRGTGDIDTALSAATRAWRSARTKRQHFDAAFIAADLAARQERFSSAQIWLRRADQYAPDDRAETIVAQAYRNVSARNPLTVQLSFSFKPSDNINNGFDPEDSIIVGGLGFTPEQKISGYELGAGLSLSYRLSQSDRHSTEAFLQASGRRAILDSDDFADFNATPFGPIARDEFDYASLSFGLSHRRALVEGLGPTGLRATFGAAYYRRAHLSNFGEISVTQDVPRGEAAVLRFGLTLRDETRFDSPSSSYLAPTLALERFGTWGDGNDLALRGAFTYFRSDGGTTKGRQVQASGRMALGREIFGTKADASASVALRDFPIFDGGNGRTDVTLRLGLGLTASGLGFYGFEPRLDVTASETSSTVDAYDRRSLGVGLSFVSRF